MSATDEYYDRKIAKYNKKIANIARSMKGEQNGGGSNISMRRPKWGNRVMRGGGSRAFGYDTIRKIQIVTGTTNIITYNINLNDNPDAKKVIEGLIIAARKFEANEVFLELNKMKFGARYAADEVAATCIEELGCSINKGADRIKKGKNHAIRLCLDIVTNGTEKYNMMMYATEIRNADLNIHERPYIGYVNLYIEDPDDSGKIVYVELKNVIKGSVTDEDLIKFRSINKTPNGSTAELSIDKPTPAEEQLAKATENAAVANIDQDKAVESNDLAAAEEAKEKLEEQRRAEKEAAEQVSLEQAAKAAEEKEVKDEQERIDGINQHAKELLKHTEQLAINLKRLIEEQKGSPEEVEHVLATSKLVCDTAEVLKRKPEEVAKEAHENISKSGGGGRWWSTQYNKRS
jgi:hypothetical protein